MRSKYLGFKGDLCFVDTVSNDEPTHTGLGSQFLFCYLEETDPLPPAWR